MNISTKQEDGNSPPSFDDIQTPLHESEVSALDQELQINDAFPGLVRGELTALILDVNNLYKGSQENGFKIDYGKLRRIFETRCDLRFCGAFSAVDPHHQGSQNWVAYMLENGYTVETKDLKRHTNSKGQVITKGNMDVEITIAALSLSDGFSHVIIGSCDGDFVPLIDKLREGHLRKVSVLGMRNTGWTGMNETLVQEADNFYDLISVKDKIEYLGSKND